MCVKLREENINASKVEIPKMDIAIGDFLQLWTKIYGLRIAWDKQQTYGANALLEELSLLTNHAEVLHVLNANHNDILRNYKPLPICHKPETAFLWISHKLPTIQHTRNRFVCVNRETRTWAYRHKFGVTRFRCDFSTSNPLLIDNRQANIMWCNKRPQCYRRECR